MLALLGKVNNETELGPITPRQEFAVIDTGIQDKSVVGKIEALDNSPMNSIAAIESNGSIDSVNVVSDNAFRDASMLSKLEIKEVMNRVVPILNTLYRAESIGGEGKLTLQFEVGPDGHINTLTLICSELDDPNFVAVVIARVKGIVFPVKTKRSEFPYVLYFKL